MAHMTATITFPRPDWLHMFDFSSLSPMQVLGVEHLAARDGICTVAFSQAGDGGIAAHVRPSDELLRIVPELAHFGVVGAGEAA